MTKNTLPAVQPAGKIQPPLGPGIPSSGGADFLTTKLDFLAEWIQSNSLWPMPFGTACCAIEFMSVAAAHYDIARFGSEVMRFSPRQADLLIVAGTVVDKMAPVLKKIYDQMPEPKWVISMGVCASTGGFYRAYHVVQGIDEIVPVDVYVAGCPPTPENLLHGLILLQEKIRSGELARHRTSKTFVPIRVGVDPEMPIPAYSQAAMAHLPGHHALPTMPESAEDEATRKENLSANTDKDRDRGEHPNTGGGEHPSEKVNRAGATAERGE